MAARRISSTSIDWAEFAKKIPTGQRASFNALKSKQYALVRTINALPAELPQIEFANYRNKIAVAGMVDNFEKQWGALKIPFPADKITSSIDAEANQAKSKFESLVAESNARKVSIEAEKKNWEKMIPLEEMNREEALEAVPWLSIDVNNPTHYPHDEKKIATINLDAHFAKGKN
ncbi:ATP synthase subunit d, mitochondrial [Lepeophtheirus salmonis]|uniref:ATP synthase subunit d, mitochondrial n=1 Tax=Lepeophtheirus salmonis TaxID=72036 RepID=C1BTW5_LEPSM|nr:ATP synthase subunit d, mitochondrial-like [Lepeophtheirus salmonis]ACO12468.1 ATP synthase subunit d, mitochondrial [Lepeophtheirus salmonis]ADD24540.1 ATP synthase subunit d, mitochondrial [Lepeophtheirus salmonis]